MVEMRETAEILACASARSLVILDEIGRGTITFDGLSIAWAVAEHLHDSPGLAPRTLFATHYHELSDLARAKDRVGNAHFEAREWGDEVVFLRRLVAGGASRSYGIQVARLAGLPAAVVERAREILSNLESGEFDERGRPRFALRDRSEIRKPGRSRISLRRLAAIGSFRGSARGRRQAPPRSCGGAGRAARLVRVRSPGSARGRGARADPRHGHEPPHPPRGAESARAVAERSRGGIQT